MEEANRKLAYGVLIGVLGAFAGGAAFYLLKAARQAKADAEYAQSTGQPPPRPAGNFGASPGGNPTTEIMEDFPF